MLYSLSFTTYVPPPSFIHRKDESNPINQPINHLIISLISTNPSHQSINQSISQSVSQSVNDEQQSFLHTISNKGNTRGTTRIRNRILPFSFDIYIHTHTHTHHDIHIHTSPSSLPTILSYFYINHNTTQGHTNNFILFFFTFHQQHFIFHREHFIFTHTHTHIPTYPLLIIFLNLKINNKNILIKLICVQRKNVILPRKSVYALIQTTWHIDSRSSSC